MNSKDYWAQREAEQLKHNITEEAEYSREIQRIYSNMLDACNKEINAFYGKYASKEGITLADAKKRVSTLDIKEYERKAARYVRDKDFSPKANEEMRLYNATMRINRLEMLKANIGLEMIAGHDELDKFMGDILKGRTMAELERQAGILGKTVRNNAKAAHAIVNGSFHSGTFSDRIWQYQDIMREDLGKLLQTGLIRGKNPRAIAGELKKYWFGNDPKTGGGARYCMERLMRTELARVQTEAQKQSFERNGFEEYEFITNGDCCDICKAIDGKHFKVADMMPGENAPPMHPHCRCSTAAHSDRKEYEEWLDFLEKGGTTEEYNKLKGKLPLAPKTAEKAKEKEITSVKAANDFTALDNYLQKAYNISVDKSVKDLSFKSVKDALTGTESVIKKFPGLIGGIKKMVTGKSGVMSCNGADGKISFNPFYFKDDKKLLADCERMSNNRWWTKNASPASIGAHEAAHSVEWLMIQTNKTYEYEWQRIEAWNKCTEAKGIVSQACKNVKKTEYGKGKRNFELISSVSRYAQENASETMAESFADVFANGENASPLSLEIVRLTEEKVKDYEGS